MAATAAGEGAKFGQHKTARLEFVFMTSSAISVSLP
jgi:hypothetical protein